MANGILDWLFHPANAGLLNQQTTPQFGPGRPPSTMTQGYAPAPQGQQGGFLDWANQHQNALFALSAGLSGAPSWQQGIADSARYAPQGIAADRTAADTKKKNAAVTAYMKANGGSITPEQQALFANDPELAQAWLAQSLTPKAKPTPYSDLGKVTADQNAGFLTPEEAAAQRSRFADGGYRPATAEEKTKFGVPEGTPLMIGPTGKPEMVGGSGMFGGNALIGGEQAKSTADGVRTGMIPPNVVGKYTRYTAPVYDALMEPSPEFPNGFDLSKANLDWQATSRYVTNLNSNQMLTLRNAISQVDQSIDLLSQLNDQWQAGGYPPMNEVRGQWSKFGAAGAKMQSIYTQMAAQVADVTAEMGSVLMKGNSPTDHGLELAAKNLDLNSPYATFVDSLAQLRENISYKKNSMNLGPAGVANGDNPYLSGVQPPVPEEDPNAPPPDFVTHAGEAVPPGAPPAVADETAPAVGAIKSGDGGKQYRFKGGDQYDQNNWILVQ